MCIEIDDRNIYYFTSIVGILLTLLPPPYYRGQTHQLSSRAMRRIIRPEVPGASSAGGAGSYKRSIIWIYFIAYFAVLPSNPKIFQFSCDYGEKKLLLSNANITNKRERPQLFHPHFLFTGTRYLIRNISVLSFYEVDLESPEFPPSPTYYIIKYPRLFYFVLIIIYYTSTSILVYLSIRLIITLTCICIVVLHYVYICMYIPHILDARVV